MPSISVDLSPYVSFLNNDLIVFGIIGALLIVICLLRLLFLWLTLPSAPFSAYFSGFHHRGNNRTVTWKSLLAFLICVGPGYACLSAHSDGFVYLIEGHRLCTKSGVSIVPSLKVSIGISEEYDTASYSPYSWSTRACRQGNCGTTEECASANKIYKSGNSLVHKHCKFMQKNQFTIFCMLEPCWIWTEEMNVLEMYKVFKIGNEMQMVILISGVDLMDMRTSLQGYYYVKGSRDYICPSACPTGFPCNGQLGDVQFFNNSFMAVWNWDCDTSSITSSGSCKHPASYMAHVGNHCNELPTQINGWDIKVVKGDLEATPTNGWRARTNEDLLSESSSHCHDHEAVIMGHEGMSNDVIAVRSQGNSDAVLSVNISCLPPIEISCDSTWKVFPHPGGECLIDGEPLEDKRIKFLPDTPNDEIEPSIDAHHYMKLIVMVILVVVVIIVVGKIIHLMCC